MSEVAVNDGCSYECSDAAGDNPQLLNLEPHSFNDLEDGEVKLLLERGCELARKSFLRSLDRHKGLTINIDKRKIREAYEIVIDSIYRAYTTSCDHEQLDLMAYAFEFAIEDIERLVHFDDFSIEDVRLSLGLLDRRVRDSYEVPYQGSDNGLPKGMRTNEKNIRTIIQECLSENRFIFYYLDCARMHADFLQMLSRGKDLEYESWGAAENLWEVSRRLPQLDKRSCKSVLEEQLKKTQRYVSQFLAV